MESIQALALVTLRALGATVVLELIGGRAALAALVV